MRRTLFIALAALAFAAVVVGCGGDGDDAAVPTDTRAAVDELQRQADEAERLIDERVEGLTDVRSLDDLSAELDEAREDVERQAEEVEDTEVRENLEEERDQLAEGLRDLSNELENVEAEVDEDDLRGAFEEARDIDALDDIADAIRRIRDEAG
jgi:hypothetical protein